MRGVYYMRGRRRNFISTKEERRVVQKAIKAIDSISTWIGIPFSWLNIPLMLIMTYDPTMRFFFSK